MATTTYNYNLQLQLRHTTLHYIYTYTYTYTDTDTCTCTYSYAYTTLHYATLHYATLHYATLRYSTLHCTTTALHHATSRNCGAVTTATIATTPKTQLQPPWFTTTNLSYKFPIFETSATFLFATTGMLHVFCYFEQSFCVTLVLEARQTQWEISGR